jgi:hypothetical protein
MDLDELAGRLGRLGAEVSAAARRPGGADPGARAFAADGPGVLFALGRALYGDWVAALAAREREAAAHGARLAEAASRLRWAAESYRDAEEAAARRYPYGAG